MVCAFIYLNIPIGHYDHVALTSLARGHACTVSLRSRQTRSFNYYYFEVFAVLQSACRVHAMMMESVTQFETAAGGRVCRLQRSILERHYTSPDALSEAESCGGGHCQCGGTIRRAAQSTMMPTPGTRRLSLHGKHRSMKSRRARRRRGSQPRYCTATDSKVP